MYDDATHNYHTFLHVVFSEIFLLFFLLACKRSVVGHFTDNEGRRFSKYVLYFCAVDLKHSCRQDRDFNRNSVNSILLEA